ncbi:hypothetical protein tb265_20380 [Gemmatimonadetes bacterium T265]|nr:hypothetical protein tb265_20380 [Gemmatimonadetes bacterium T265]
MAEASLARVPGARRRGTGRWRRALAAAAGVLAFWYGATGLLLALERSDATRLLALGLAVAAAVAGAACVRAGARGAGAGAAARAVLGGALLWVCVSATFYGGWVVGPAPLGTVAPADAGAGAPSLARAAAAVAATAYSSLLAAALLLVAVRAARGPRGRGLTQTSAAGRYGPIAFATLWAAHELAKLNVFLGVASPGAAYLPAYLAHFRQFFGPARNSPLLAASVVALGAAAAALAVRARRADPASARRTGLALLAGVLALATFEHAMLGVRTPPEWWDAFVGWREQPAHHALAPDRQNARPSTP